MAREIYLPKELLERVKNFIETHGAELEALQPGSVDDLEKLHRSTKLLNQYALTVAQYNNIRISSLPPGLEKQQRFQEQRERYGEQFTQDIAWLWSYLADLSGRYERTMSAPWDELSKEEKDESEALTYLHNWVKLVGLQKWSAELVADGVRRETRRELLEELLAEADEDSHPLLIKKLELE